MEASLLFPVCIFAIITIILILLFFYEQSVSSSHLHIALRYSAGQSTERTVYYFEDMNSNEYEKLIDSIELRKAGIFPLVCGKAEVSMLNKGILRKEGFSEINASWRASDGVKFKRLNPIN